MPKKYPCEYLYTHARRRIEICNCQGEERERERENYFLFLFFVAFILDGEGRRNRTRFACLISFPLHDAECISFISFSLSLSLRKMRHSFVSAMRSECIPISCRVELEQLINWGSLQIYVFNFSYPTKLTKKIKRKAEGNSTDLC